LAPARVRAALLGRFFNCDEMEVCMDEVEDADERAGDSRKPKRVPWNTIELTAEAQAEARRLYEQTPQTGRCIAIMLGISHTSLKTYARREGWTKCRRPPVDLTPAAKLSVKLARAELGDAGTASLSLPPRSGGEGRVTERQRGEPGWGAALQSTNSPAHAEAPRPPTPNRSPPLASLAGGGEKRALARGGEEEQALARGGERAGPAVLPAEPVKIAPTIGEALAHAQQTLANIKSDRERAKQNGGRAAADAHYAHAIRDLADSIERLLAMQAAAQQRENDDSDLDARRDALAQRIESLVAEWMDAENAGRAERS
jgi:hypothetical protein